MNHRLATIIRTTCLATLIALVLLTPIWGQALQATALADGLRRDVEMLSTNIGARSGAFQYEKLQQAAQSIQERLKDSGLTMSSHTYRVDNREYTNLVFDKTGEANRPIILVGAHYDTVFCTPGADDNASGVAVVIALAQSLASYQNRHPLRFVFFTLEEPPYFRTAAMGSRQYAKHLQQQQTSLKFVICLDMVGFYSDEKIQQTTEEGVLIAANFAMVVSDTRHQENTEKFFRCLPPHEQLPIQLFLATPQMSSINLSDHASFWEHGYPGLMITDTAFYRNQNYHELTDTAATLDYQKMALLTNLLLTGIQKADSED